MVLDIFGSMNKRRQLVIQGRVNYQEGVLKRRRTSCEHFPGSLSYSASYTSEFVTCRYLAAVQAESV